MSNILQFAIFLLLSQATWGACPSGWIENDGQCYYFSSSAGLSLSWHDAKKNCESMGANLVVIETEAENNYLKSQLSPNQALLIGLHDLNVENQWQWVDGTPATYIIWGQGQPDNWADNSDGQEDCVEILENQNGAWNDVPCSMLAPFICERKKDAPSSSSCPSDWTESNGKCYFFSTVSSISLSWHEAQSKCETMRGNLVIIETETENTFLYNQLSADQALYIGLHDLNAENQWEWVDGSLADFVIWGQGQPDNWDQGAGGQEDCVEILQNQNGAWNDLPCSLRHPFICERDTNLEPYPNCQESDGWEEYNDRCYKVFGDKVPWTAAEASCSALDANLVAITSDNEQYYVANEVNEWDQHMWIGLSSVNHPSNSLYWSNGVDPFPGYDNWGTGQPVLDSTASNCVEIDPSIATNGPWGVDRCGESHAYMCETGLTGSCAPGWYFYKNRCYFEASSESLWATWIGAKDLCATMGATLVQIDSYEEQIYINSRLPALEDSGSTDVWIGISDSENDGTFVWIDGSSATSGDYTYWQQNQPRDQVGAWDCGQIYTGSSWGGWEVDDCFKKQAFMCEIPPGQDVKPSIPVAPTATGCDPGWLFFSGNCYYFEYEKLSSWFVARADCQSKGADLISILSGEEDAFIVGHVSGTTWLGANDNEGEGKFTWSDGSPWAFSDWYPGEPNNNGGEGDCAQLWMDAGYKWDDVQCDRVISYVCKMLPHDCDQALGMEDHRILDSEITANSQWNENHAPYLARLNNQAEGDIVGAWVPAQVKQDCSIVAVGSRVQCGAVGLAKPECEALNCCYDNSQGGVTCFNAPYNFAPGGSDWIQVHLVPERTVSGITTQGRPANYDQYVTSYQIGYSNDGVTFQKIPQTFTANSNTYAPITNRLPSQIVTSYIRLYPMTWNQSPTLRMEVLGCNSDGADLATPSPDLECTSVPIEERLDCGYAGIDGFECINKGCCWDSTVSAVPWCFYKKGDYDTRCGKDWTFDPGGEYKCYHFNDYKKRTWSQSREYCISLGGELLSINSQREQGYVTGQLSTIILTDSLWIGANNLDTSTGWQWSDGAPFNFFAWRNGEPNGYENNEQCTEVYTSDGTWNDLNCANEKGIACKKFANIAPPQVDGSGNIRLDICEGESGTLVCTDNSVITVHHAAYGRSDSTTCTDTGIIIPEGGCLSIDSLDITAAKCDNRDVCTLDATNNVYGDPCYGIYKYLSVIYSCENKACYQQLGVENGTVTDSQIFQSSYVDNNHRGTDGRLNGERGWATDEGVGAWIQVTFPRNFRISGLIMQGSKDVERYVTTFKVAIANDETFQQWTDYKDFDGNIVTFNGNTDATTPLRVVFPEHVFTQGVRIYPLTWFGDMIGFRFDLTGCNPLRELGCGEIGDVLGLTDQGSIVQADCPGLCPTVVDDVVVYGTGIYSGNSQICNAAVHAGVIIDRLGGPVTVVRKPDQSTYTGSSRNTVVSGNYGYYPLAFAFTNNEKNCEAGWIPYESHCYWLSDISLTWSESEAYCVTMGGHLASIFDQLEQDFLIQTIHMSNYTDLWIGLNDLRSFYTYEWVDGEPVTYTNWKSREPNNWEGKSENCVEMYRTTKDYKIAGSWNDADCADVSGFVCKKYKAYYTEDDAAVPTPAPGCKDGWFAYEYMCYWFQRNLVTEPQNEDVCSKQGGQPVHVMDKYTQSFLHTIIGAEDKRWWLGLHGTVSQDTGVAWHWESGDPVTYDNWGKGNPTIDAGECVVFYGGPYGTGLWYSHPCDKTAYSICELPRDGFTPPPPTTPPPSGGCQWDWTTPDEASNYCYKVFAPAAEGDFDQKQAWSNAYHQCLSYNSDLVSIHSRDEETYLINELSQLDLSTEFVWIGLSNRGGSSWEWSDMSPTEYLNWGIGNPSSAVDNNCVSMKYDKVTRTGVWNNLNCQQALDWVCKIPKGIEIVTPTSPPTGVVDPTCGSAAGGVWMKYNSMCYFFSNETEVDAHVAETTCHQSGGQLVSIHSPTEQSFINNVIKTDGGLLYTDRFWIGLKEMGGFNGEYTWTDGTAVDFVYWSPGEPNDSLGSEQCVTMYQDTGKWNDANCGMKYAGFVCKKYPGGPPIDPQPTPPAPGGCPSSWLMYGNYCFQIHGDVSVCDPTVTDNPSCSSDWKTAQVTCTQQGGTLATIHNKYENAFVAAQILHSYNSMWIGLSSYMWHSKPFVWANGDEVTYTNWNQGEPNSVDGNEDCVELYRQEAIVGRWNDNRCENNIPFVCSMRKDANIADGQQINNNRKCKSGWMQFDTIGDDFMCFYLDTQPRTFDDARSNCQNMGGDLASLQSMYDQAFLTSYITDQTAWLGMKVNPDTYEWVWLDGWPVWITNWGDGSPGADTNKNCVLNKDSVLGSEWITANCGEQHMSVCKTSTVSIPATPGYVEGNCRDPSWFAYGGYCYYSLLTNGNNEELGLTWTDAEEMCKLESGNLASFTSRVELETILEWFNSSESVWIGLKDNGQGGWSWTDYRPVSFTYWSNGEPNNVGEDGEDCVEMYGDSGKWNDLNCANQKGYLCRVPKVIGTDENGNVIHYTSPAPTQTKISNGGVIAGAVIGSLVLIVIVVGVAFYCTRGNGPSMSKLTNDASEFSSRIVNKLYSVTGTMSTSSEKKSDDAGFDNVRFEKDTGATLGDSTA